MSYKALYKELESDIKTAYEQGVSLDEAEKLSAKFLYAQMIFSAEIKKLDLDSRMRKSGVKAVRAAIYIDAAKPVDGKKPTVDMLNATVDVNEIVIGEQKSYDEAEVDKAEIERAYDIAREGHIYFRGIAKGKFE